MADAELTLSDFLEDEHFAAWMKRKVPKFKPKPLKPPWVVYVLRRDGRWGKVEFYSYKKAYEWLMQHLGEFQDAALNCRKRGYAPPIISRKVKVRVRLKSGKTRVEERQRRSWWGGRWEMHESGYRWCPHCRRPTRFNYFRTHHAIPKRFPIRSTERRCHICGVAWSFVRDYRSEKLKW